MIVYKKLTFPILTNRPYFFSNFVSTIDGRTVIKNTTSYLPIGSPTDFETFLDLRKYADALIHGKHTAALHRTVDTIAQKPFLQKRKKQDKPEVLPYYIITNHPDVSLIPALINNSMEKPYIVTHTTAVVPAELEHLATIVRIGEKIVDLQKLTTYFFEKGYKHILVEGGPTLMGSFLEATLLDEVFLTIAPKILGGYHNEIVTMVEGKLLDPSKVGHWKLLTTKIIDNELFLRYRK